MVDSEDIPLDLSSVDTLPLYISYFYLFWTGDRSCFLKRGFIIHIILHYIFMHCFSTCYRFSELYTSFLLTPAKVSFDHEQIIVMGNRQAELTRLVHELQSLESIRASDWPHERWHLLYLHCCSFYVYMLSVHNPVLMGHCIVFVVLLLSSNYHFS